MTIVEFFTITDIKARLFGKFNTREEGEAELRKLGYAPSEDMIKGWFPGGKADPIMKQGEKQLWVVPWKDPLSIEELELRILAQQD